MWTSRTSRTNRNDRTDRHQHAFRKDNHMQQFEQRFAAAAERQERFRFERAAERQVEAHRRPIRLRLGQSLMRLGHRVGGEAVTTPAWQA